MLRVVNFANRSLFIEAGNPLASSALINEGRADQRASQVVYGVLWTLVVKLRG